jgi:hypothetical protein
MAFWMFAIFVRWIPVVNVVMIILWAFVGQNESRRNYFKALIAWFVIAFVFWVAVILFGFSPLLGGAMHSLRITLGV